MKIKFIEAPKGRDFKVGDVVDFKGHIPEGYARKYIHRGWAVEHVEEKPAVKKVEAKPVAPKVETKVDVKVPEEKSAESVVSYAGFNIKPPSGIK